MGQRRALLSVPTGMLSFTCPLWQPSLIFNLSTDERVGHRLSLPNTKPREHILYLDTSARSQTGSEVSPASTACHSGPSRSPPLGEGSRKQSCSSWESGNRVLLHQKSTHKFLLLRWAAHWAHVGSERLIPYKWPMVLTSSLRNCQAPSEPLKPPLKIFKQSFMEDLAPSLAHKLHCPCTASTPTGPFRSPSALC